MKKNRNSYKFEELIKKIKALGYSINKNSKKAYILGVIVSSIIISGYKLSEACSEVSDIIEVYKVNSASDEEVNKHNDETIEILLEDTILVADVSSTLEQEYYFNDGYLYDREDNLVFLDGEEKNISFVKCKIDSNVLNNINLSKSHTKYLVLDYSSIDDECINCFPSSLEYLSLTGCRYITNLDGLGDKCPNIRAININVASSLSDLSFIYELPYLQELYISDCPYITEELLVYLRDNNITTNISEQDVINSRTIDTIVDDIVSSNMNDREKVKAVCLYILDNFEYDIASLVESNDSPLEYFLEEGRGVCSSYAYLTNVLLNKVGVSSYMVVDDEHAWNMIKLDGMYYYIDTTNMDDSLFNEMLLSLFNIAYDYMVDPENVNLTVMSSISDEETIVTSSLLQDVINGNSNKDIFEKYGNMVLSGSVSVFNFLCAVMVGYVFINLGKLIITAKDICCDIRNDYLVRLNSFNHIGSENNAYYGYINNRGYVVKVKKRKLSRNNLDKKVTDR